MVLTYWIGGSSEVVDGMEVEIQLRLQRFLDSSVSSLILAGWFEEGHPATKNLLPYQYVDNWVIFPLVVELTLVTWGWLPDPGLAYDDDDVPRGLDAVS